MMRTVASVAGLVAILAAGCSKADLGLPRVALEAESPDGRYVALVRNHPAIDPPSQSLRIGRRGESPRLVRRLAEDMDWCDTIAWSADSSTAAFVVRGARLLVVEAATGETVFDDWVVEWRGEYPPAIVVRGLALDATGSRATFRGCSRRGGGCQPHSLELRPGPPAAAGPGAESPPSAGYAG